tara:strand:- start:4034 stop:4531 length:498 start_codon:yes stop_codon:yes gene_type:complete
MTQPFKADLLIKEIGVDMSDLMRRLEGAELQIFQDAGTQMLKDIQAVWVGWKYKGRPPGAARNVSRGAWKQELQVTEGVRQIILINRARDWRTRTKSYAAYVARSKGSTPEYLEVLSILKMINLPQLTKDLIEAVRNNFSEQSPVKRLRVNKKDPPDYESMDLDF